MAERGQEDERTVMRRVRADVYFEKHLSDQRRWYSDRATVYKTRAQWLSLAVIIAGGLVTFVQVFQSTPATIFGVGWPAVVSAALALFIIAAEGIARIWRYQEAWISYRKASEEMKREYRLYINGAGDYEKVANEDAAYRTFVAKIEHVIAEEQQLYWRYTGDNERGERPEQPPAGG